MLSVPIHFEQHFNSRQQAVIEKEQYIIKLVQGYRDASADKKFTTNWDELIDFALNGTMQYRSQIYDENNLKNAEILAELRKDKNWKNERVVSVPARDTLFDDTIQRSSSSIQQLMRLVATAHTLSVAMLHLSSLSILILITRSSGMSLTTVSTTSSTMQRLTRI